MILGSYILAYFLYPRNLPNALMDSLLDQTFYIFFGISIFLSLFLLFTRSSFTAILTLLIRCYLIMIQGYAIEGFLSYKLILGIGLIIETGILLSNPYNIILSFIEIAGLLAAQFYLPAFGHNQLVNKEIYGTADVMITMGFVLVSLSAVTLCMVNFADSRKEISRSLFLQKESMKTLTQFNLDLQSYARTIDSESSERERNRISRELHDISGYIFTNMIALLNAAASIPFGEADRLTDILTTARLQAQEGLRETRIALRKIRAVKVNEEEGVRALNKIVLIFQKVTGIKVDVSWGNIPFTFSREINFALYRTVQEALTNAIRHGQATEISIHFWVKEKNLKMTISDNGLGAEQVVKGIGITGMEERIGKLNGNVNVSNNPDKGFSVNIELPLSLEACSQI